MPFTILASTVDEVNHLCEDLLGPNSSPETIDIDKVVNIHGIDIHYHDELHVGPLSFDAVFVELMDLLYPNQTFDNCLDWCSGAGFIGFSLFGRSIVNKLTLTDAYNPAILACNKTIAGLDTDKIDTVLADSISQLPIKEYDLIVGNPPWMPQYVLFDDGGKLRRNTDPDFKLHRDFFSNVKKYLSKNGKIILLEGLFSSSPIDFKPMVEENGLSITKIVRYNENGPYFIVVELNT